MVLEREAFEKEKAQFAARKAELELAAANTGQATPVMAANGVGADIDGQNIQNIQQTTNITYVMQAPVASNMVQPAP